MQHNRSNDGLRKEEPQKQANKKEQHNPFKNADEKTERQETPEEEAKTEQQRKEALTERD